MITTDNIVKYYNDFKVLKGISLNIHKGEIFSLLGPNGAGKTTLCRILTGQIKPASGTAVVAGFDVIQHSTEFKYKIGVMFEQPYLYERLTVFENLQFFARVFNIDNERIEILINEVSLEDKRNVQVRSLSKGQRQRVSLARTLLHDPEVIFLDEPTSGLDPNASLEVRNIIKNLSLSGRTVFLTTHYMEEADQLSHRVAFINKGEILCVDTPEVLKREFGSKILEVKYEDKGKPGVADFRVGTREEYRSIGQFLYAVKILDIRIKEPELEDIFIRLTGDGEKK